MDQQMPNDPQAAQPVPEIVPATPHDDVEENKDMAALSYAWILSLVVFFTKRESPFARFHAKQGIVLFVLSIVFWMVPFVGKLLELVILGFCAYGFIEAAQGKWKELPFIAAMARGDWKAVRATWKSTVNAVAETWKHVRRKKPAAPQPASAQPAQAERAVTPVEPTPVPVPAEPAPTPAPSEPAPAPPAPPVSDTPPTL